jgi:hypothetical protein
MKVSTILLVAFACLTSCQNQRSESEQLVDSLKNQLAQKDSILQEYSYAFAAHLPTAPTDTIEGYNSTSADHKIVADLNDIDSLPMIKTQVLLKKPVRTKSPKVDPAIAAAREKAYADSVTAVNTEDEIAWAGISWAWSNTGPCTREILCKTYIGNFMIFFKGKLWPFSQVVHRWFNSAHYCMEAALDALKIKHSGNNHESQEVDELLAIAWAMASQIHNEPYKEWQRTHGDAVLRALRRLRILVNYPTT